MLQIEKNRVDDSLAKSAVARAGRIAEKFCPEDVRITRQKFAEWTGSLKMSERQGACPSENMGAKPKPSANLMRMAQ